MHLTFLWTAVFTNLLPASSFIVGGAELHMPCRREGVGVCMYLEREVGVLILWYH